MAGEATDKSEEIARRAAEMSLRILLALFCFCIIFFFMDLKAAKQRAGGL